MIHTPHSLNIFVVSNIYGLYNEKSLCSQLRDCEHTVTLWNKKEYIPLAVSNGREKNISENRLCSSIKNIASADLIVLFAPMSDESFLAGMAYTSGVRVVCIGEKDAEMCPLTKATISYWCDTLEDVVSLANNWEDPIPNLLEENS